MFSAMKFTRTKKLVFFNNKWGVGKTTIAYNTAVKFAEKWYKTVLVDLDAQCNLSRLALGENFDKTLFSWDESNIFGILKGIVQWWADVRHDIKPIQLQENLSIVSWSLNLSKYENLLISAYGQAASGETIWYFQTSAVNRYLSKLWLDDNVDIFIIDISPNLGLLNRIVLLWADYFITPLMPDAFSLQWIENLWSTYDEWKKNWKNTWRALAGETPSSHVLDGEWLFVGYIVNSYNQYNKKPISSHEKWIKKIPQDIKKHISEKHCKNWLVEKSWKEALVHIKDYWELASDSHNSSKAIFNLEPWVDFQNVQWTRDNLELSQKQFETLFIKISDILHKY